VKEKKTCEYGSLVNAATTTITASSPISSKGTSGRSSTHPVTPAIDVIDLAVPELRLLHHFTTTTVPSLSSDDRTTDGLREYGIKLAFDNPYLLHGMLALAALHLSRLEKDKAKSGEYVTQAVRHHDAGLTRFREDVQDLNLQNYQPVLFYSTIVYPYYSALPVDEESGPEHVWDIEIHHLSLIRGIRPLISPFWPIVFESELAQFIWKDALTIDWDQTPESTEVSHLRLLPEEPGLMCSRERKAALSEAIRQLEVLFSEIAGRKHPSSSMLKVWPHHIPAQFVDLLAERDPAALIVFAHYSVMLDRSVTYWFMEGSSARILRTVQALLKEERWNRWLQWPLKEWNASIKR